MLETKKIGAQEFANLFNVYIVTDRYGDIEAFKEKPYFEKGLWTFDGNEFGDDSCDVTLFVSAYTSEFKYSLITPEEETSC